MLAMLNLPSWEIFSLQNTKWLDTFSRQRLKNLWTFGLLLTSWVNVFLRIMTFKTILERGKSVWPIWLISYRLAWARFFAIYILSLLEFVTAADNCVVYIISDIDILISEDFKIDFVFSVSLKWNRYRHVY